MTEGRGQVHSSSYSFKHARVKTEGSECSASAQALQKFTAALFFQFMHTGFIFCASEVYIERRVMEWHD